MKTLKAMIKTLMIQVILRVFEELASS